MEKSRSMYWADVRWQRPQKAGCYGRRKAPGRKVLPRVRGPLDTSIPKTVQAGSGRTGICLGLRRHAQMVQGLGRIVCRYC